MLQRISYCRGEASKTPTVPIAVWLSLLWAIASQNGSHRPCRAFSD